MARFELVFKRSIAKDIRALEPIDVRRILQRIEKLAVDPRPKDSEKLSGQERYRVRQGSLRILYEIDDSQLVVTVVKIGHWRDVYR
ncbi:MAG: type II toxin-antitoxin system RelE/ParE family toxin [Ottowia sp.]|nr:type II toxin-antitoxin system RelE/ParE family toxin [Ottowia sp.]